MKLRLLFAAMFVGVLSMAVVAIGLQVQHSHTESNIRAAGLTICYRNNKLRATISENERVLASFISAAAETRRMQAVLFATQGDRAQAKGNREAAARYVYLLTRLHEVEQLDCQTIWAR